MPLKFLLRLVYCPFSYCLQNFVFVKYYEKRFKQVFVFVCQRIENGLCLPFCFNEFSVFEFSQVLRNCRNGHSKNVTQVANTKLFLFIKQEQDFQSDVVTRQFKSVR